MKLSPEERKERKREYNKRYRQNMTEEQREERKEKIKESNKRYLHFVPYCLVLGEPNIYHYLGDFTRLWGFYLVGCRGRESILP